MIRLDRLPKRTPLPMKLAVFFGLMGEVNRSAASPPPKVIAPPESFFTKFRDKG